MAGELIAVVDAGYVMHRAWYALPGEFQAADGQQTRAVLGMCRFLSALIRTDKPDHVFVCYDGDRKTWRHRLWKLYKRNRKDRPADWDFQTESCRRVAAALGCANVWREHVEADDLIASVVEGFRGKGADLCIYTSDSDMYQLLRNPGDDGSGDQVTMRDVGRNKVWNVKTLATHYGIRPDQVTTYKAIAGDSSDGYPGVSGIGRVGAQSLIQRFGKLPAILAAAKAGLIGGRRESLIQRQTKMALLCHKLAALRTDLYTLCQTDLVTVLGFDMEGTAGLLGELGIRDAFLAFLNGKAEGRKENG